VNVRHYGVERYVDVTAGVKGRGVGAVEDDVESRLQRMSFPLEYTAEVIRPSQDVQPPASLFISLSIAALVGIFLLLQAAFGSWRLAALVAVASPVALLGGVAVILADGGDISLGGAFGLLAIGCLALRHAILLVSHLQDGDDVVRGVRERFGSIVTSLVAIAAALAPFAIAGDIAGNEITHATASVVLGGLVTSAVFALFLVPALYLHFGHGAREPDTERATAPPTPAPQATRSVS